MLQIRGLMMERPMSYSIKSRAAMDELNAIKESDGPAVKIVIFLWSCGNRPTL